MTPTETINKAIYYKAFFAFGLLPMLLLLEEFEQVENYSECALIKAAIDEVNATYQENLCTHICKEAYLSIELIHKEKNSDFNSYKKRLPMYLDELKRYVRQRRLDGGLTTLKEDIRKHFNF